MTDIKKKDYDSLWQTKDIRAINRSIRWRTPQMMLQSTISILLDMLMLYVSWTIADRLGTPTPGVDIADTMAPILAINIGTLAASGFYGTDDRLHRFAKLFKSLLLAQVIILAAAFFERPGLWWMSRSVFSISLVLNFLSIGGARFLVDLFIIEMRKHHPIFQQAIVLVGNKVDIDRVKKLLKRSQQFRVDSVIDLSVWDMDSQLEQILDRIQSRKVSEVFVCSQQVRD